MIEITYLAAPGTASGQKTSRIVVVDATDPIDAQRMARATDPQYQRLLDYRRLQGQVVLLRVEPYTD